MVVVTALVGENTDLFGDILHLYAYHDSRILDMTFGRGMFWNRINVGYPRLITLDAVTPAMIRGDFRSLPFQSNTFDVVVFDPPYAKHAKIGGTTVKESLAKYYQLNHSLAPNSHDETMALYASGMVEASRVLERGGRLILKCQDDSKHWTHIEFLKQTPDWRPIDLFILIQHGTPLMRYKFQSHARKNHSYFVILERK